MTPSERILSKALAASGLDSDQWSGVQAALRDRAFFSARINDARALAAMRQACAEVAAGALSASDARARVRAALDAAGIPDDGSAGFRNPHSRARLDLVLQTNVRQARGYAAYLAQNAPGAIDAAPGQELRRVRRSRVPRRWEERWRAAGGAVVGGRMVALKADPVWTAISRFGVPWPPFDFNSGMGVRPLLRPECVRLGLLAEDEPAPRPPPPPGFNDDLEADISVPRTDDPVLVRLRDIFGNQITESRNPDGTHRIRWEGSLMRDFAAGTIGRVRMGRATPALLAKLPPGMAFPPGGIPRLTVDSSFRTHVGKHAGDALPLRDTDLEMLPSILRDPERVAPGRGDTVLCSADLLDGSVLEACLDLRDARVATVYRRPPLNAEGPVSPPRSPKGKAVNGAG